MKLASLFSGGKDSTFSILKAREMGHEVVCVVTVHPFADDSLLFHYANSWAAEYLATAMKIPWLGVDATGRSKADEIATLDLALGKVRSLHSIEGILFGGISSVYQKREFESVCSRHKLVAVAPLWHSDPVCYMNELVERGFKIMIVGVSAMGLGSDWLGTILDRNSLFRLASLSKKYGFNLTFEGGEAETLVTDCPLFRKRLEIRRSTVRWDGQRGIFEIQEVALVEK